MMSPANPLLLQPKKRIMKASTKEMPGACCEHRPADTRPNWEAGCNTRISPLTLRRNGVGFAKKPNHLLSTAKTERGMMALKIVAGSARRPVTDSAIKGLGKEASPAAYCHILSKSKPSMAAKCAVNDARRVLIFTTLSHLKKSILYHDSSSERAPSTTKRRERGYSANLASVRCCALTAIARLMRVSCRENKSTPWIYATPNTPGAANRNGAVDLNNSSSAKLCECGCGQLAPISTDTRTERGWVEGEPKRFVKGHHFHTGQPEYKEQDRGHVTPCWVWQRSILNTGYGQTSVAGRMEKAHRAVYEREVGPIPEGLVLDHLCKVRSCVRPSHLEPVTQAENVRRRWAGQICPCCSGSGRIPANRKRDAQDSCGKRGR